MSSLSEKLTNIFEEVFAELDLPIKNARVQVSGQSEVAQFQCNGAMASAKAARKNPREIAQNIIDTIKDKTIFEDISIGGAGFINMTLKNSYIEQHLKTLSTNDRLGIASTGKGQSIVLDYGGPNIAKAMHVGHLRSSIIGDSLRRVYKYAGYNAIGDVHMGDWGTPMGMILSELDLMKYDGEITMKMLAEIYPKASGDCKDNKERMALAREATRKLQDGNPEYTKRWRKFIDVSIEGMKKNFDALGVHFDEWKGESDAHPYIENMINGLKSKNIAIKSDGALIIPVSTDQDKKELPPLMLLKSDGAVLYGTTDLATIVERMENYNPVKIIYIVDQRQHLHFEQVFRAARKSNIAPSEKTTLIHAGFGTINGTDGKPFKTRSGGVMPLGDLIYMAIEKAQNRIDEAELAKDISTKERYNIAHNIAIAAIKFADLQNNRNVDYIFDIDRMTSFEGKTGPYLLYQAVRIKSLLQKAAIDSNIKYDKFKITENDLNLSLLLCELPEHFSNTIKHNTPHILCDYVFKLAQEFSSFYGNCHILSEQDEAIKNSRLALCQLTHRQIALILSLLGIDIPERM